MQSVLLSSLYLAPIHYYSKLFGAERAIIEIHDNYQRQSYRNRCTIVAANGPIALSVPIEKPVRDKSKMKDIRIADHGNWQHLHWNALISAYNSTPFFDYYRDEFSYFYHKKFNFLLDFNEQLRALICKFIGIETSIAYSSEYRETYCSTTKDYRESIHPKKEWQKSDPCFHAKPYYQVFGERHGFIANASIVDLLFNMGNEARLYLQT